MLERIRKFLIHLFLAFGFLTIVPGLGRVRAGEGDLGRSAAFFPIAGLLIGFCWYLLSLIPPLSPFTTAVVAVVFSIAFTRGLHADGVIDTLDGFLSGKKDRDEILAVMKDSRVGALGLVFIFSLYVLKIALFYEILLHQPASIRSLLILPPLLARGGVAFYAFFFPPAAGESSLGRSFLEGVRLREVIISVLLMELLSFRQAAPPALFLPAAVLLFWLCWGYVCRRRIGGITGDTIGAGIEFAEVVGLLLLLILAIR